MQPRIRAQHEPAAMLAAYIEANLDFLAEHPVAVRALVDVLANARSPTPSATACGPEPGRGPARLLRPGHAT
ncbi:hypothetical protein AB0F71_06305 [Kitasatospora sp. NPDC028055]|uniref:hypothetical protein n=1 Tax=Kitasatospora sp. NPDC028055 TaxID=3155653 RepID=UPI0033E89082